jgi:PAS domain S-box-containing protein
MALRDLAGSESLRYAHERLELLSSITRDFAESTTDYPGLMEVVARRLAESLGAGCEVYSLTAAAQPMRWMASYASDPSLLEQLSTLERSAPWKPDEHAAVNRVIETGEALLRPAHSMRSGLFRAAGTDGTVGAFSMMVTALRLHGRTIGLVRWLRATPFDQSDQKFAQMLCDHAALAIGNARSYEAVVDHARHDGRFGSISEGYTILDRDFRYVYVNEAAARHTHADPRDLLGKSTSEIFPNIETTEAHAAVRRCMEERTSTRFETEVTFANGEVGWFEVHIQPVPEGVAILSIDDSDRRRALNALKASEARLQALAESGIVSILVGDSSGHIEDANAAFLTMLGYTEEELRAGRLNWHQMTPPEQHEACNAWISEALEQGALSPREKEYLRRDGSRVSTLVGLAKLDATRLIAIIIDISEQKRQQEALRLMAEQLRHAQKMEAVGRLAGGIAHDFNNILSAILCYTELIDRGLDSQHRLRHDVDELRKSGIRAADLTKQLLIFSRQQVVEPKVVDLSQILSRITSLLERTLGADVELALLVQPDVWRVEVDPTSIELVIMNLAANARDAMPLGGKLTIEVSNVELDEAYAGQHLGVQPGPHVLLAVTDTGTGMDAATRNRVFDPFFTTKDTGKGTGLGLATVLGMVQQSGGSVWIYSELDHGTCVKVYLPRSLRDLSQDRGPESAEMMRRGTETVLLVEDQQEVRTVAGQILRASGYVVLEAADGAEALRVSEEFAGSIELLLTDVVMPKMSGPTLARNLARTRPEMRVLCMSGYTEDSVLRRGLITGELAFLEKPFTATSLTRKVREVLEQSRAVAARDAGG